MTYHMVKIEPDRSSATSDSRQKRMCEPERGACLPRAKEGIGSWLGCPENAERCPASALIYVWARLT
jgi:hypothetical protein